MNSRNSLDSEVKQPQVPSTQVPVYKAIGKVIFKKVPANGITPISSPVKMTNGVSSINKGTKLPNKCGQCEGCLQVGCQQCVYCKADDPSLHNLCSSKKCLNLPAPKKRGRPKKTDSPLPAIGGVNGVSHSQSPSPASPLVINSPVTDESSSKKPKIKKVK